MPHRIFLTCLVVLSLFSGCAYQGVVVEKHSRPLPFPESLGVDGMYSFQLQDQTGQVHSQMVTDYVFTSYRVGDYFNDLEPLPGQPGKQYRPRFRATPELMEPQTPTGPEPMRTRRPNDQPYHPVRTTNVHRRHASRTARVATKKHRRHRANLAAVTHRTGNARTTRNRFPTNANAKPSA
jgi:hypothetical protein